MCLLNNKQQINQLKLRCQFPAEVCAEDICFLIGMQRIPIFGGSGIRRIFGAHYSAEYLAEVRTLQSTQATIHPQKNRSVLCYNPIFITNRSIGNIRLGTYNVIYFKIVSFQRLMRCM